MATKGGSTTSKDPTRVLPTTGGTGGDRSSRGRGAKRSSAKKPTTSKAGSSRKARSTRASGRGTAKGPAPARRAGRVADVFAEHVGDRSADAWGLLLLLVAVIAGMGTYADAAGPVGAFLAALLRSLLGAPAVLVPALMAALALAIIVDRPVEELGRIGVGASLLATSGIGLWHLALGAPHLADPQGVVGLHRAGGVLGHVVSRPLVLALSTAGAVVVLLFVLALGGLIATGTPLSRVFGGLRSWLVAVPARRRGRNAGAADDEPAVDDDDGDARTPGRRRRRGGGGAADADAGDAAVTDGPGTSGDPAATTVVVPRRATIDRTGEQVPLPGTADDGLSDADRLAGRAPAPVGTTGDGVRRATPLRPLEGWADYELPDLAMLAEGKSVAGAAETHIRAQADALQETFSQFSIDASVARWSRGPTVTQFEIELGPGVKVSKVANLGDDIAYALAAPDVRIVAPIPGRSAIGVEVPNRHRDRITLGDILRSDTAQRDQHPLHVALGVDIAGNPAMVNLAAMPHLLVAGATGSGKSVTLNAMITSVVMRARPDQVRMILIDPKQVELNAYEGAPHLLTPVVTDPRRAADAVAWCVKEMEMRYETLARLGYRNIDSYNEAVADGEVEEAVAAKYADPSAADEEKTSYSHMPYVLLVIDELADLMMVAGRDVEDAICRIAQKARAVGIHMVIATQRPSVDVITGLIKANIPSRLALAVSSQTDSRTILDGGGAEKLVGHGDMLFLPASQGKPSRLQGCFVSEREIEPVVAFCKEQRQADFVKGVVATGEKAKEVDAERGTDHDSDEALLVRAADQVVTSGLGSVSMLQRKLRIGFARAGRLMDELEELGVVGENEGSKAREVNWTPEMLDEARSNGLL